MRSIEDKGCLNQSSNKSKNRTSHHHHRTGLGKPTPSKWDDAQKWLVNLSRGGEKNKSKSDPRDSNADDRILIAPVPKNEEDYSSGGEDEEQHKCLGYEEEEETKKVDCDESVWRINKHENSNSNSNSVVRSICVRDMGTEMTPIASQEPSRTATPIRSTTPAARSPITSGSSTPIRCQNGARESSCQTGMAITNDTSRGGVTTTRFSRERELSVANNVPENSSVTDEAKTLSPLETRAMAWDEAERAKYMARYKREEVRIQAWENHEKRKAEMEMKRMEVKAERLKSRAQEKYTNKLVATSRIAEEKRANAEDELNEKAVRASERADYIRRTGHLPSSFSFKLPSFCW